MSYHLEIMDIGSVGHPPLKLVSCALSRRYHAHLILLMEEYSSCESLKNHLHVIAMIEQMRKVIASCKYACS